jgi:hypothetical protein
MREGVIDYGGRVMLMVMLGVLLQAPNPLQLFDSLWLTVNDVVLVCAYAIGTITVTLLLPLPLLQELLLR